MSRRKVWWEVKWDVPTFSKSPGRLEYVELVKAPNSQIAFWKASKRFVEKMQWVLENKKKSIGGTETGARVLLGEQKQAGRVVRNSLKPGFCLAIKTSWVEMDPDVQVRLDQIGVEFPHKDGCSRSGFTVWHRWFGRKSKLRADVGLKYCLGCGVRQVISWEIH